MHTSRREEGPMSESHAVLSVEGLRVCLATGEPIVEDVDLHLAPREIVCLVGESGSGKTTLATALLGYSAGGVRISNGDLSIDGRQMSMDDSMRSMRGSFISYV